MNDTHTPEGDITSSRSEDKHPVDELAEMDPADAPGDAERYAASLVSELEDAGASGPEPVQLAADLGDTAETDRQ